MIKIGGIYKSKEDNDVYFLILDVDKRYLYDYILIEPFETISNLDINNQLDAVENFTDFFDINNFSFLTEKSLMKIIDGYLGELTEENLTFIKNTFKTTEIYEKIYNR